MQPSLEIASSTRNLSQPQDKIIISLATTTKLNNLIKSILAWPTTPA